jgi:hypothetical protein
MSRTARLGIVALLAGLLVLAVPSMLRPVEAAPAQEAPLPTDSLIPLLAPLQPVLEVISPIVYPLCSNAVLVTVLPGATGVELPPELSLVTGPLLVLCGSVPIPGTNTRVCALDAEGQALLAEATKPLIGAGLPVEVAPAKWITGLLDNIVDRIDLPGIPLGSTVAATLQCVDPPPESSTTLPAGSGAPSPSTPTVQPAPIVDLPTFADLQTLPPLAPSLVAAPTAPEIATAPVVRLIDQPRFRYPVVMGLPLALLALLVFFGRVLTRPITRSIGPS